MQRKLHEMKTRSTLSLAIDSLYHHGHATSDSYTQLILQCIRSNDIVQAKRLQTHMDLHLFQPHNSYIHNRLLQLYAKFGKVNEAQNLFDKMPHKDVFSRNAMLTLYSKSGSMVNLCRTFDEMPVRDGVSYNTVIAGLAGNGFSRKALEVFVEMERDGFIATGYSYVGALHACSELLDLRCGKQIQARIFRKSDLMVNVYIWNALTDMFAKCCKIDKARWLFDQAVDRNVVTWNSMISGYVRVGQMEKCIDLFNEMQLNGLKADRVTISNVLNAYVQGGCFNEAMKLFTEFHDKDEVCWTTVIVGYSQNDREEDALKLFSQMLSENVRPDSFTISSIVSSCAKLASLSTGQTVHGKAVLMGIDSDLLVSTALIDMYCKCGSTKDALVIFYAMPSRNVVCWNAMIGGFAQNGQELEAFALYEKMLQECIKPDDITFVAVLSACVHANLVDQGKKYFNSINEVHGSVPSLDHYTCMVNLLGCSGQTDKALNLIQEMPHEPNSLIWSALLSVCTVNGDIAHGEIAARHLFDMEPLNAGPYILLSNMYAACARWKDVASVRLLMKKRNVKKLAAYSWVEVDNQVQKFVSGDRTHPETGEIYEELYRLIKDLSKVGFSPDSRLVLHDVDGEEKVDSINCHSEKLALAYSLLKKPHGLMPIRILKNIRVCGDCHEFMKFASKTIGRSIILRDVNRYHHFTGGKCSCKDYW